MTRLAHGRAISTSKLTVGNLHPEDDFMHAVSEHASHNESMFFNFFDSAQQIGGFVRIGNRPNEGHAEMTFCVFLPGGGLLMQWAKPAIASNALFSAAGLDFRVLEPARRFQLSYDGPAVHIKRPLDMQDPGRAMRSNPIVPARLQLMVRGVGPMIGDRDGTAPDSIIFLDGVGHYQQAIAARGELTAGSDRWSLNARGVRDHSWGPRLWHSILRDRSLWISFGEELTIIACKTWLCADCEPDEMGCVIERDRVTPLRSITMRSHFTPQTYYHDAVILEAADVRGREFRVHGDVLAYVPLRHRKAGQQTIYLGQAMTHFRMGELSTVGLSEYFDAESATPPLIEHSRRDEYVTE
jgi:hypothetical protein